MNLITWLARAARAEPGRVALFWGARPWATYGELATRVARLAGGMRHRLGLMPGERVAICMKNSPEYLVAMYAAWWAGLVAVPVNAKLHAKELDFIAGDCGARWVIRSSDDLAHIEDTTTGAQPLRECDFLMHAASSRRLSWFPNRQCSLKSGFS